MKIAKIPTQYNTQQKNNIKQDTTKAPNFTGGFDLFLRFLDTNQAWGATAVDAGCMVLPRTITDFGRGVDAGLETGRREGSGTINHSAIGLYGLAVGTLLATGINKAYDLGYNDIKAGSIFADSETLDLHSNIYDKKLKSLAGNAGANPIKEYLTEVLKHYEALSPTQDGQWVRFSEEQINTASNILNEEIHKSGKKLTPDRFLQIKNTLMNGLGVENNYRIISEDGVHQHSSRYTLDYIITNTYKLGKTFNKEKVKEAFINSVDYTKNAFLNSLKSINLKRSLIGIGIGSAIGMSVQPINIYLTQKKTGSTEFVGGGKEDKSFGFKVKKMLTASAFAGLVLATIGNPKNLAKNLQFKGFTPTLNQFKFIYGATIFSRFLAARNDNELKESSIKDTLGFVNWLILGNFVQKLVAKGMDSTLIKTDGKGFVNWIKNSVLKSRDEVLFEALGDKVFDKAGKALDYKNLEKLADKATKKKLNILTISQLLGYLYSGVVLGVGIPKLNIYLTNKRMKKLEEQEKAAQNTKTPDTMFQPVNINFLNTKNFTSSKILG